MQRRQERSLFAHFGELERLGHLLLLLEASSLHFIHVLELVVLLLHVLELLGVLVVVSTLILGDLPCLSTVIGNACDFVEHYQ